MSSMRIEIKDKTPIVTPRTMGNIPHGFFTATRVGPFVCNGGPEASLYLKTNEVGNIDSIARIYRLSDSSGNYHGGYVSIRSVNNDSPIENYRVVDSLTAIVR